MLSLFEGRGIDIGCGDDPVLPTVDRFDKAQGDAQRIRDFVDGPYDFVFASHVLEHMIDPRAALEQWYSLVKPGGHLIVLVPDEDLYEQGVFPSLFNDDHKHTFTIAKGRSWSPVSINVLDLVRDLDGELVSVEVQDHGYDRKLLHHSPGRYRMFLRTLLCRLARRYDGFRYRLALTKFFSALGAPID